MGNLGGKEVRETVYPMNRSMIVDATVWALVDGAFALASIQVPSFQTAAYAGD